MHGVRVVDHPVLSDALRMLRSADTRRRAFRARMAEVGTMLAYEALRDLPVEDVPVTTPLEETTGRMISRPIVIVAILRAGLGLVDGFLRLVPDAAVGHVGLQRDEDTLKPTGYYESLPSAIPDAVVFLVDPMLATGGSAAAALARLRAAGAQDVRLVALVAAPEGIAKVRETEPDVPIVVGALDRGLDERGYIRPGLGDAGDRIFGTDD